MGICVFENLRFKPCLRSLECFSDLFSDDVKRSLSSQGKCFNSMIFMIALLSLVLKRCWTSFLELLLKARKVFLGAFEKQFPAHVNSSRRANRRPFWFDFL